MRSLLFFANEQNDRSRKLAIEIKKWCKLKKIAWESIFYDAQDISEDNTVVYCQKALSKCEADIIIAAGGDGTLLKAGRVFADSNIPILPVCTGNLGFLMLLSESNVFKALEEIVKQKKYVLDSRDMLCCNGHLLAVNEFSITATDRPLLVDLEVIYNGQLVTHFRGDGLLISTPTGATGYNLSAGGPIIWPQSDHVVLTPLYPHSLVSRSVVLPLSDKDSIMIRRADDRFYQTMLISDGHVFHDQQVDFYEVRKYDKKLSIIQTSYSSKPFFSLLSEKLDWR